MLEHPAIDDAAEEAPHRRAHPRHRVVGAMTWRSLFRAEPGRWKSVRSFIFDLDLGLVLRGAIVGVLGLGFTVVGVVGVVGAAVQGAWNLPLLMLGAALLVGGVALAFFAWVNRTQP